MAMLMSHGIDVDSIEIKNNRESVSINIPGVVNVRVQPSTYQGKRTITVHTTELAPLPPKPKPAYNYVGVIISPSDQRLGTPSECYAAGVKGFDNIGNRVWHYRSTDNLTIGDPVKILGGVGRGQYGQVCSLSLRDPAEIYGYVYNVEKVTL